MLYNSGIQCEPDPLLVENMHLQKEVKELKESSEERDAKGSRMTYWTGRSTTPNTDKSRLSTTVLHPIDQLLAFK
ncbi:hypothetical protein KUTeg_007762 [Tegillarca granosa]|uniref:Uncharacterized protein n=1 Tax=Tegillarca granosa TaxID=220873 RepID=A0ABQ9FI65_TEGGR|nr:hypothetical protein KUTeg_007762 [Tegillarca granosa]